MSAAVLSLIGDHLGGRIRHEIRVSSGSRQHARREVLELRGDGQRLDAGPVVGTGSG
jgi:hypothetical protein